MAEAIPDLWPDIEQSQVVPPVAILREQAAALGKKTSYLLNGRVSTRTEGTRFVHSFYIVAPALDDYSYALFSIEHGPDQYPVYLPGLQAKRLGRTNNVIESDKELIDYIRDVLNSDNTKKVVGSLLAQVKATT
jgi:hypothetical protein